MLNETIKIKVLGILEENILIEPIISPCKEVIERINRLKYDNLNVGDIIEGFWVGNELAIKAGRGKRKIGKRSTLIF